MKKIIVNQDKCIGCGACEGLESSVFEIDDTGFATTKKSDYEKLTDEIKENVDDAIANCPTNAIGIKDSDEMNCDDNSEKNISEEVA